MSQQESYSKELKESESSLDLASFLGSIQRTEAKEAPQAAQEAFKKVSPAWGELAPVQPTKTLLKAALERQEVAKQLAASRLKSRQLNRQLKLMDRALAEQLHNMLAKDLQ